MKYIDQMHCRLMNQFADDLAAKAVKSLLYEVCVSPKPGLVDRFGRGAHQDMDIFTFVDSATALTTYFRDITLQAWENRNIEAELLLPLLKDLGLLAEERMFAATGGVNTHKGAIYSLGILCAAYGYCFRKEAAFSEAKVLETCSQIALSSGTKDFTAASTKKNCTNGEWIYRKHQIKGARGEVASGFLSVRLYSLPILRQKIAEGWDVNTAGLLALFYLMANIDDTNIIARSDCQTQKEVKARLKEITADSNLSMQAVKSYGHELDTEFIRLNISAGGAADLLSITWMLYFIGEGSVKYK